MLTENIEALIITIIITACVNFRPIVAKNNKGINVVNVKCEM